MNLTRYFRKNARTLLMVFMALLLVTFLIPQTIQGCDRQGQEAIPWGKAFGRQITTADLAAARGQKQVLALMGQPLNVSDADYLLLTEEAEQAGIRVGKQEVIDLLQRVGVTDTVLQGIQLSQRMSYDDIYRIIGRWVAVERLAMLQNMGEFASLARQRDQYRLRAQTARAEMVVIDASAFEPSVGEPTEEQLTALFEAGKTRDSAHTDSELVFGYKLPDRVSVEYLTVDPNALLAQTQVRQLEMQRYFEDNRPLFMKPNPAAGTDPQAPPQIEMTFDEAREQIRATLRDEKAIDAAGSVMHDIFSELHRPWITTEVSPEGFQARPDTDLGDFRELQQRYSDRYPIACEKTGLVDQQTLSMDLLLGQALLPDARRAVRAPELAFRVQGILASDPNDGVPVFAPLQPIGPLFTQTQRPERSRRPINFQPLVMRVIEVAPAAPPASLDEVRAQVIKDWKRQQALAKAKTYGEQLAARAREVGLAQAAQDATELRAALAAATAQAPEPLIGVKPDYVAGLTPVAVDDLRRPMGSQAGFTPKVGYTGDAAQQLFDLASDAAPHKIALATAADYGRVIVAELQEVKPIYDGAFEEQLAGSLLQQERFTGQFFGFEWKQGENVQRRARFEPAPRQGQ